VSPASMRPDPTTMSITPRELLDTSLGQLQVLVAFLRDQLGETGVSPQLQAEAVEVRACREVLLSLNALIAAPLGNALREGTEPCLE
jgi:hypothetical protein